MTTIIDFEPTQQSSVEELNDALEAYPYPQVFTVETGASWTALVVGPRGTTQQQAQAAYDKGERQRENSL